VKGEKGKGGRGNDNSHYGRTCGPNIENLVAIGKERRGGGKKGASGTTGSVPQWLRKSLDYMRFSNPLQSNSVRRIQEKREKGGKKREESR